jgi:hypothetical protein
MVKTHQDASKSSGNAARNDLAAQNDAGHGKNKAPLRLRLNAISYHQATVIAPALENKACCVRIG